MNMNELEAQLQLLNTSQSSTVQWSTVAQQCLSYAEDFLNKQYNYYFAIVWFEHAVTVYEKELTSKDDAQSLAEQAYIGAAMSYHNVGRHIQRDECMAKARNLLAIPNNVHDYTRKMFSNNACNYFVVDGYRGYIRYENSNKKGESLDQQEKYLQQAKDAFYKAIEIAQTCDTQTLEQAHAYHGLGTIFEFLSKCQQERGNKAAAQKYLTQSINTFEQALVMRKQLLGEIHPHVARSYHKLARNYVLLSNLLDNSGNSSQQIKEFYQKANTCYQQAITIFEKNNIPKDQAKRQELENEYEKFKTQENL